jgi:hypothetical protein
MNMMISGHNRYLKMEKWPWSYNFLVSSHQHVWQKHMEVHKLTSMMAKNKGPQNAAKPYTSSSGLRSEHRTYTSHKNEIYTRHSQTDCACHKRYLWLLTSSVTFFILCWTHALCWSSCFSVCSSRANSDFSWAIRSGVSTVEQDG